MVRYVILCLQVLVILAFAGDLQGSKKWGEKQLYPAEYIPDGALDPKRQVVRRKIVLYHNFFRSKVRPTASNMLLMPRQKLVKAIHAKPTGSFNLNVQQSWHTGAARQAQRYAEQCIFLKHNSPSENTLPGLGACGQNLFVAAQKTPWFFALKTWFVEYRNFTYADPASDLLVTGHYTQMVWATSHKVGCGLAHCPGGPWGHFYNYVCHYCPGGNYDTITHYPYKKGKPCDDCPGQCVSKHLCQNPCYRRDLYSNCNELVQNVNGFCKQGLCNATCECTGKIHKNYPW